MRETEIERLVVKTVENAGGIAYKFVSPGRDGVPDRLCVLPDGLVFFVETKAPGKKPQPAQVREHRRLRRLWYKVLVVDSLAAAARVVRDARSQATE